MPMKVCYTVVNGQVMSENRNGAERDYIPDALGNTLALMDSTGAKTDTFDYFPSGTVASRTGTTATPLQWNGGSGYYRDNSKRTHVRARNFNIHLGRWQEPDPIGFAGGDYNLYRYVDNRVTIWVDPSGERCRPFSGLLSQLGHGVIEKNAFCTEETINAFIQFKTNSRIHCEWMWQIIKRIGNSANWPAPEDITVELKAELVNRQFLRKNPRANRGVAKGVLELQEGYQEGLCRLRLISSVGILRQKER